MRSNLTPHLMVLSAVAAMLTACQQRQEDTPEAPAAPAADVTVNPPPNVTVNPPDVNIKAPDVNLDAGSPDSKVTRESTTVDVPGVGSTTTTTVEKK